MSDTQHVYALIMAGGKGTRFWPLSRLAHPKQLLPIADPEPMVRVTVDRILPIIPPERILVITGASHADQLRRLLPDLPSENIIAEPVGRNTAPCIGLGAHIVSKRDSDGVMIVLPADHVIAKPEAFQALVLQGIAAALEHKALVTLGIQPTRPETGYGYIEAAPSDGPSTANPVLSAIKFHEKPNLPQAQNYLAGGRFYWNSGMFIWAAEVILDWFRQLLPRLAGELETLAGHIDRPAFTEALAETYPRLESISIDYGVMEKAKGVLVIPADIGWSDVGSWRAAAEFWPEIQGNLVKGQALCLESSGCVVYSQEKLVTLIGVKDLVVVETPDALLVCPKERDQDVRLAVEALQRQKRDDLL